jgi:hypothetical protein
VIGAFKVVVVLFTTACTVAADADLASVIDVVSVAVVEEVGGAVVEGEVACSGR